MDGAKAVKRHNAQYDLFNRLHSIASDQAFVEEVSQGWYGGRFEVVPNQRCGTWYCPPSTTYAYFKSTDGHTSNWNFNLRRANQSLASYAEKHAGLILVDSTRRGKRMPDALSKTIPIWCSVINRAVARRALQEGIEWEDLYLPAGVVSSSEREQIIALLSTWTDSLLASGMTLPPLQKPLRPFFLHPSTSSPPHIPTDPPYTPIICLSVSRWVGITGHQQEDDVPSVTRVGERNVGFEYVPGAGDDDELWAKGLTPGMFWKYREKLLGLDRGDLEAGLQELKTRPETSALEADLKGLILDTPEDKRGSTPTNSLTGVPTANSRMAVDLGQPVVNVDNWSPPSGRMINIWVIEVPKAQTYPETIYTYRKDAAADRHIGVALPSPKADSWGYKAGLMKLVSTLERDLDDDSALIIRPATLAHLDLLVNPPEKDIGEKLQALSRPDDEVSSRKFLIPIILLILCLFPHLHSQSQSEPESKSGEKEKLDKGGISTVLLSLVGLWPDGNPPRAALKRVNEILLGSGKP